MKKQTKKLSKKKASNIITERPDVLNGKSYKLKDVPNGMNELASLFVTINSHKNKPYEIFIDVKDKLLYEHLTVYSRLISMMLRKGKNTITVKEISEELKSITSDSTAHYIPKRGVRVNSLAARIGVCLIEHKE